MARTPGGDVVVAQIPSAEVERLVPGTQVRLRVRPVPALAINPAD